MKELLEFEPAYAILTLNLDEGESIKAEPGAMIAQSNTELTTKSGGKGFFKSLERMLGGESFFLNTFTGGAGGGWVSIGPGCPGDIRTMEVEPGREIFIQGGSYLGSTINVKTDTKFQGWKGVFSGEGIFFLRATSEDGLPGKVWYSSFGAIKEMELNEGQEISVDTGHVVAFEDTTDYTIDKVGGVKSFFLGGEGLVMKFKGTGKIWIQTRTISGLAGMMVPFLPHKSN